MFRRGVESNRRVPRVHRRSRRRAKPRRLLLDARRPRYEGLHEHPARPRGASRRRRVASLRAQRRMSNVRPQRRLRTASAGGQAWNPRDQLRRREDPQAHRRLDPRADARRRQVHQVPPLRQRLRRDAARRRPVPAEPRLRHRDRPRVRARLANRGVRSVRPVCGRVSGRRDHRKRSDRRRLAGARQARQPRHRANRARHPRRARRVLRLSARHAGDRQNDRPPCAASASTPSSTPTSPPI